MKFCFVAQNIYSLLIDDCKTNHIGGAELQQLYIGKGLVEKDVSVQFITQDFDQDSPVAIDKIEVFRTFHENAGWPIVRFLYPRLFKIWNALKAADADIYYVRSAGFILGIVALFCRLFNKKVIFAGAHDTDFIPGEHLIRLRRDIMLYHYGIKHCDKVIVQSLLQKELLTKHFGIQGSLIRNISLEPLVIPPRDSKRNILWVATIRSWKRPGYFINLARQFPDEKFIMIGGKDFQNPELYNFIAETCEHIENIDFLGFVPLEKTETYFDKCKVFVNTSEHEGFPNTFLQAWRRGVPVLSFVDPDNVVRDNHLGLVVSEEYQLKSGLETLLSTGQFDSKKIRDYFLKNHSSELIDNYMKIIKELSL